jgi:hypothetical protein
MLKSDFSNYTGLNGRGNYLVREMLYLIEQGEMHPATAAQLRALFAADAARVDAALVAAAGRVQMSGPNGGPRDIPATAANMLPATASIAVGATQQLTVTTTPTNATDAKVFTSGTPGVATVSATGLVTGVSAGSATITVTVGGVSDTSVITVTGA